MIRPARYRALAATASLLLLTASASATVQIPEKERDSASFQVGDITIEIDKKLQKDWDFSDFRKSPTTPDMTIEGVAQYRGGPAGLYRWYAYDKDGVKIQDGPLGYQDYPLRQKTRFEMFLGNKAPQVTRIKITAENVVRAP
jgi:hypothetical protein